MVRLASMLFGMISTTLAGALVVVALVMGYTTLTPILIAAGVGFVVALPASVLVARAIMRA